MACLAMEKCDRPFATGSSRQVDATRAFWRLAGIPLDELLGYMADCGQRLLDANEMPRPNTATVSGESALLNSGVKVAEFRPSDGSSTKRGKQTRGPGMPYTARSVFKGKLTGNPTNTALAVITSSPHGRLAVQGDQGAEFIYAHLNSKPDFVGVAGSRGNRCRAGVVEGAASEWPNCRRLQMELINAYHIGKRKRSVGERKPNEGGRNRRDSTRSCGRNGCGTWSAKATVQRLADAVKAWHRSRVALPHILIDGPSGSGKTTFVMVLLNELHTHVTDSGRPGAFQPAHYCLPHQRRGRLNCFH